MYFIVLTDTVLTVHESPEGTFTPLRSFLETLYINLSTVFLVPVIMSTEYDT